jgi:hypothetical protein
MLLGTLIAWTVGINTGFAVGLTYVDANANPFGGDINLAGDAFALSSNAVDQHWGLRAFGAGGSIYESGGAGAEDAPEITQTVTGLTPGTSYDMYAVFWSSDASAANWMQRAGVAPGVNTLYDRLGPVIGAPTAVPATYATSAVWDVLPAFPLRPGATQFHEDDRSMLLGKAGTVVADGSGNAVVYLNDLPGSGNTRSFFDGVAYAPAGTPIALTLTIDRSTGSAIINNPTPASFQFKSYTISSTAGALNAATWTPIHNRLDAGGSTAFDTDPWNITAPVPPALPPYTTQLAEAEDAAGGGTGGTLTASGGSLSSINLGNIWNKTRFSDVVLSMTLADGSTVTINPQYTGAAITATDFNGSGGTDLADFQTMLGHLNNGITYTTLAEAFQQGDINGDQVVNGIDFVTFRNLFSAASGSAAFDHLLAQVPEPAAIGGLLLLVGLALGFGGRRSRCLALALLFSQVFVTSSQAVPFLAVDVNGRGTVAANTESNPPAPTGTDTVSGFGAFTLTGTGGRANDTVVVNGYTVTVTARNASNAAAGALDDRDRSGPTTAPTLGQLYDDFILAGTSTGLGGGLDLEVTGPGLQPNKQYSVAIYSYDPDTNSGNLPRTANWLDANKFNTNVLSTSFDGRIAPVVDDQFKTYGIATTDAAGKLFLRARSSMATNDIAVFLNGFELSSSEMTLEVNTTTGATRLLNEQGSPFNLTYYDIRSVSGSLNPSGWTSLDDGEGGDPVGTGWDEAPASNTGLLNEVRLTGSTPINALQGLSLGNAFNTAGMQDLKFYYATPDEKASLRAGFVKYVTGSPGVPGDYNNNGVVDAADYVLWRKGGPLQNEVDTPGTVNAADYTAWRARFGNTSGSGTSLGGSAVPEPSACCLLLLSALGGFASCLPSRRRTPAARI